MSQEIEDQLAVMRAAIDQILMNMSDLMPALMKVKQMAIENGFSDKEAFDFALDMFRTVTGGR